MFRRMVQAARRLKIRRPRVATILVVISVAILFAVLNRPYERVELYDPDIPIGFISNRIRGGPGGPHLPYRVDCCGWPLEMRYAETFHHRPQRVFWSWSNVAINLAGALTTLVLVWLFLEARARRAKRLLQLTLVDGAVILLACSIGFAVISAAVQRAGRERAAAIAIEQQRERAAAIAIEQHGWASRAVRATAWQKRHFDVYDGPALRQLLSCQETVVSARLTSNEPKLLTALQACTQLERLLLQEDDWRDLRFLSSFPCLMELTVHGEFDGEALSVLRHLPRLRILSLASPNLDDAGLENIARYSDLYWLSVDGRFGDAGVMKCIAQEQDLHGLYLASPNVSDVGVAGIAQLENLEQLSLTITAKGETLHGLSGHQALQRLYLPFSRLEKLQLEDVPNLEALGLPYQDSLNVIALINLPKLPRIPQDDGFGNPVGPNVLRADRVIVLDLPELAELDVECSSDGEFHLAGLPKLERLRLQFRRAAPSPPLAETASSDDRGMAQLKQLPALRHLDLSDCPLNAAHLVEIAELSQLRVLDLTRTKTTDEGAAHLGRMRALEVLTLAHTNISDAALATFVGHPRLSWLCLDGTDVTEKGLAPLLDLPSISDLHLHDTKVNARELQRMNETEVDGRKYVKAFIRGL